jgi:hypothetical protein
MTRGVGRALATGFIGTLAAVVWLTLFYALRPELRIDFNVDPPQLVTGVYPAERATDSSLTFAWTREQVTVRLPGIDRHVPWTMSVRVRGARLDPRQNPILTFSVDGLQVLTHESTTGFELVQITIPVQADRRGAVVTIRSSTTFIPGPSDPRPLGVMLDSISFVPTGVVLPPHGAFTGTAAAAGVLGSGVALLDVTAGTAIGGAMVIAAGIAMSVSRGFGPYTDFAETGARVAVVASVALVVLAGGAQILRREKLRNTARFVAAFSACALVSKLLVLLHPDMPIGDALFHAHRFQDVLAGKLYFTSIAPGNYSFPYAPGLYLFATLFSGLVRRGMADVALLRIIVVSVDTIAALCLYRMVVRNRGDRIAGALAVALYHLVPLEFGVIRVGNLTNAFAQSVSLFAFAMMAASPLRTSNWRWLLLFVIALSGAFLSHTSTFAILSTATLLTGVLFWWRGGAVLRSSAVAILIALALALIVAIAVYYAHFIDTYRAELSRLTAETATAAPDAGGRGIGSRLATVPYYLATYLGIPALALMCWGVATLWRGGPADRLALSTTGWGLACVVFLAVGVLTPLDMRYYLASIPAVAILAAIGGSAGWASGGYARAAIAGLLVWIIIELRGWFASFG